MRKSNEGIQLSATDLVNFLGCKHLTELDRSETLNEISAPDFYDPSLALLQEKGREHEEAYEKHLAEQGHSIYRLEEHSNEATLEAMKKGYDYILQAGLYDAKWNGRADFLKRIKGASDLGDYHYDVATHHLAK